MICPLPPKETKIDWLIAFLVTSALTSPIALLAILLPPHTAKDLLVAGLVFGGIFIVTIGGMWFGIDD